MEDYRQRRDATMRPLFEQTLWSASARDDSPRDLDTLRAVLLNQHDARKLIRGLPALLDQMLEPMDWFRHAFIATKFDAEVEAPAP